MQSRDRYRVVDLISLSATPGTPEWTKKMLLYDKKFTVVELCVNYDKAVKKQDSENKIKYRDEIYKLIGELYADFSRVIRQENFSALIKDKPVEEYLKLVYEQIENAKEIDKNPRELLELSLIKLAILRDHAREDFRGFNRDVYFDSPVVKESDFELTSDDYVSHIMELPLSVDTQTFKNEIGPGIASPIQFGRYAEISDILPICSSNGSIGFNTILFALFNGYLPVGFGASSPLAVHTNLHNQESYLTARHDYGHVLNRVNWLKENDPEFFNQCRTIYFNLFEERKNNQITDDVLQKEILMLFFIVYERGYSPTRNQSLEQVIRDTTNSLEDVLHQDKYLESRVSARKEIKKPRPPINHLLKQDINRATILETIDFVKPLKDLGYEFPDEDTIKNKPWKAAAALRNAFFDILDGFSKRHNTLKLSPIEENEHELTEAEIVELSERLGEAAKKYPPFKLPDDNDGYTYQSQKPQALFGKKQSKIKQKKDIEDTHHLHRKKDAK